MKNKFLFLLVLVSIFSALSAFAAKSKPITREAAAKVLKKMNYGVVEGTLRTSYTEDFFYGVNRNPGMTPEIVNAQETAKYNDWVAKTTSETALLESEGFINTTQTQEDLPYYYTKKNKITVTATDKLSPYILGYDNVGGIKIKLADVLFDKVTGVTTDLEGNSIVEFDIKTKRTPLFGRVNQTNTVYGSKSALFKHYDDGWRYVGLLR